jgi:hypothetical protein
MEALVVKAQPTSDLPDDIAPQRADGLPVARALRGLEHDHRGDHLGGHRRVASALPDDIGEQLRREQLVAVVGRKAYSDRQEPGGGTSWPRPSGRRRQDVPGS